MAWIESHQTLRDHPKLSELAFALGITKAQAIGHLHMLWWWCINYADDGNLSHYSPAQIAAACDWIGSPEDLIKSLTDAGFIDSEPLRVHDWLDFCGDLIKKRLEYKKAKHRRVKHLGISLRNSPKSQRKPENSQPTVTVTVTKPAVPDLTVTNQKKKTPSAKAAVPFWQELVQHLNDSWSRKKKGAKYLWAGKDFSALKRMTSLYQAWDVMALWDIYIASDDEFARKQGFSVPEFVRQMPRLVDANWKPAAQRYMDKLMPINPEGIEQINTLIGSLGKEMPR